MKTFETTTMLANLATKLTVTGVFLIDTQTTVMIKVTAWNQRKSTVPCCQCNIVQLILHDDYHFRKICNILFINYIFGPQILTRNDVNRAAHSLVTADQGCMTGMVKYLTGVTRSDGKTERTKSRNFCTLTAPSSYHVTRPLTTARMDGTVEIFSFLVSPGSSCAWTVPIPKPVNKTPPQVKHEPKGKDFYQQHWTNYIHHRDIKN